MKAEDLAIEKMLRFSMQEGKVYVNDQRVIMIPGLALGTLRCDLIKNLGMERTKGFLIRYGWNCGVSDALKVKKMKFDSEKEILWAGPKMHTIHGHVYVEPFITEYDFQRGRLHFEGNWYHSYEASEHLRLFGKSEEPICHTLVGYASGYLTTIMGKKVIVTEKKCEGMGHDHCRWVGRTLEEWDGEVDRELIYYEEQSLISELDQAYLKLKEEKDNQDKAIRIHNKLMQEVVNGKNLQSIADVLHEWMEWPVLIEDHRLELLAYTGISDQEAEAQHRELKKRKEIVEHTFRQVISAKKINVSPDQCRLMAPIMLRNKVYGYCSLLCDEDKVQDMDWMIMEQAAQACSMYLLNEQTAVETEQRVKGSFLDEVLSNHLSRKEILQRGHYVGLNLDQPYHILVMNRHSEKKREIKEELELNESLMIKLSAYFKSRSFNILVGQKSGNLVLLLPRSIGSERNIGLREFCTNVVDFCVSHYPDYAFFMGVSSGSDDILEAEKQLTEALAALKLTRKENNRIMFFDNLGIVGVMFQSGDANALKRYFSKKVNVLIAYDRSKQMDLTKTLYYFLKNGGNLEQTAKEMALSISGLRYRVRKIKELLKKDIRDPETNYEFFLAIQALILLGEIEV